MTMVKTALVMFLIANAGACGGKKGRTTPPVNTGDGDGSGTTTEPTGDPATMVSAETMDEIQRLFQRKGVAVSHCLAIVVDNKELPKNSHGKITLEVTIGTSGKADAVKVIKASLESKALTDCVIDRVKEIGFPSVPKSYPTTYTYAFEAS